MKVTLFDSVILFFFFTTFLLLKTDTTEFTIILLVPNVFLHLTSSLRTWAHLKFIFYNGIHDAGGIMSAKRYTKCHRSVLREYSSVCQEGINLNQHGMNVDPFHLEACT